MKAILFRELNYKKKYDCCISVSLFKMKNGGYKRVETYVNMFLNWSKFIPKSSFIRLYIDESALLISNFKKILEADIPLEIYMFKDERFLLEDRIHHDGTFGSMARYLAFFDEKLDVDYVWTTDMDQTKTDIRAHYLTQMKKNNIDILYRSEACYANLWIPSEVDYPIINDRLIVSKNIKVSKRSFDKFLTDVFNGKYTELKESILKQRKRLQGQVIHHFPYGFDEYYTNNILYKQLIKHPRLIYYSIALTTIGKRYPGIMKNFKQIEDNETKLWNSFHPDLNLKQKKEFEKARKEIEFQKERFKESYRLNKCLQDFDLFKDKLDINEKFSTVLIIE